MASGEPGLWAGLQYRLNLIPDIIGNGSPTRSILGGYRSVRDGELHGFCMSPCSHWCSQYMKNYPFAEARVRRETERNPQFRAFLNERNTDELTKRRDVVSPFARSLEQ